MSEKLIRRKQKILESLGRIERVRRGKLSKQFYKKTGKDGKEKLQGPYFKLQCWVRGKNHTQRISGRYVAQIRKDVSNYERFKKLCEKLAVTLEQLAVNADPMEDK